MSSDAGRMPGAPPAEATVRAFVAGMVLAAAFCGVNLYLGLKAGIGINLSIPSALLTYFGALLLGGRRAQFSILETNLAQTAASAGSAVAAAGLVTAVPTLALATGYEWDWFKLTVWLIAIGILGVSAAVMVRRQLVEVEQLPFAVGAATAGLLRELYEREQSAVRRLVAMGIAAVMGGLLFWLVQIPGRLLQSRTWPLRFSLGGQTADKFGWVIPYDPLFYALGPLIGVRAAFSIFLGAALACGLWGPQVVRAKLVSVEHVREWLSWPAVAILVSASLAGLIVGLILSATRRSAASTAESSAPVSVRRTMDRVAAPLAIGSVALVTILELMWFPVPWWLALGAAVAAFAFAVVAARMAGEVAMVQSGPLSKAAQLAFGWLHPSAAAGNIVPANVAGGAASQCGELIHDLKCGKLLGASWRWQSLAQVCGVVAGAGVAALMYLIWFERNKELFRDPEHTPPAVKMLLNVSELLTKGESALLSGSANAMLYAAIPAAILAVIEQLLPQRHRRWVPMPLAVGFGMLSSVGPRAAIPMLAGALIGSTLLLARPVWERMIVVVCIGAIIGQSLTALGIGLV